MQTIRKWYTPIEKLDGLLGVWERIPRIVKAGARMIAYYVFAQIGLAFLARALEIGGENWPFIVIAALIVTLIIGLLIEHFVFAAPSRVGGARIMATGTVTKEGEGPTMVAEQGIEATKEAASEEVVIHVKSRPNFAVSHYQTSTWVDLTLEVADKGNMWTYECIVIDPDDNALSSKTLGGLLAGGELTVRFPAEFPSSSPLELQPGTYEVDWRLHRSILLSWMRGTTVVATDQFTVPSTQRAEDSPSQPGQGVNTVDVTEALSHHAGTECRIIWRNNNRDAERLAERIKTMLTDANWQVRSFYASDEPPKPDRPPALTVGWWDVGQEQAFHTLLGVLAVMDYEINTDVQHDKNDPATIHVWSMQRHRPLEAQSIPDSEESSD